MSYYARQLQKVVEEYRESGQPWPTSARTMAAWAIARGLLQIGESDVIDRFANELARAMRDEYYIDPQGRSVRAKHCAKLRVNGESMTLWDDHRTADREFIAIALQGRRQQIVGDCKQLKIDADSYNDNMRPAEPINMVLDFTRDVEEETQG
jgi:hypothetical protein